MQNYLRKIVFPLGLLLICAAAISVEVRFNVLQRGYDNFILDSRNHYLSCEDLPTKAEVERVVDQHSDVIQQILQVATGFVGVEIDSSNCQGQADIVIWYGTHQQRTAIEKIIGTGTFLGIPYRLQNR